ncbi:MAG: hypothetical protein U1A77_03635 [Pirellulales bacterium]
MTRWRCALELDSQRRAVAGSTRHLAEAIARGADLRIYTEFRHNEHIDVDSKNQELIREVAEFGVTYRIEPEPSAPAWCAGIMSLRQPIELPVGFGARASMSFFLYNQDGTQAIARPYLDGGLASTVVGRSPPTPPRNMPKYHVLDAWDADTNAPSQNFIYHFNLFRFCVDDSWSEVLHHSEHGEVVSGSLEALVDAFSTGCAIKLAVRNLGEDLAEDETNSPDHELFVQGGSAYYYTEQRLFLIGSHPIVRVQPATPLRYRSRNWDFGWLMLRTDGQVVYRRCDPYTLEFSDHKRHCALRWFVR